MQNLDVISVNLWQILISLANLVLIFLILKKFLFKPVTNILEKRNREIDESYDNASKAEKEAEESRIAWEEKLSGADARAAEIVKDAADGAKFRFFRRLFRFDIVRERLFAAQFLYANFAKLLFVRVDKVQFTSWTYHVSCHNFFPLHFPYW